MRSVLFLVLGVAASGCAAPASLARARTTPNDPAYATRVLCWMGVAQGRGDDAAVRGACLAAGETMCASSPSFAACGGLLPRRSIARRPPSPPAAPAAFDVLLATEARPRGTAIAPNPYVRPPASPYLTSSSESPVPLNPFTARR